MSQDTKSFKELEMVCKCGLCPKELPAMSSIIMMQMLHTILEGFYGLNHSCVRIVATSWVRCWLHNKRVGGASESSHTKQFGADGVDFKCYVVVGIAKSGHKMWKKIKPKQIYELIDGMFPNSLGLGLYHNRVHVDCRSKKARW